MTIKLTYGFYLSVGHLDLTLELELEHLADARLSDSFGVQRPGRAFYAKLAGDL